MTVFGVIQVGSHPEREPGVLLLHVSIQVPQHHWSFLRWYWLGQQESCRAGGIMGRNWGSAWDRIRVPEEGIWVPYSILWSACLLFCQYILSLWLESLAWSQATDVFLFILFPATWLKGLISSKHFMVESLGSLVCRICKWELFHFFLSYMCPFYFLFLSYCSG